MSFTVNPTDFLTTYFVGKQMPGGSTMYLYGINPEYCLSDAAAANLKANFADLGAGIVRIPPLGAGWGGLFVQRNLASVDNTAPWLQFKGASGNPVILNAGVVAGNYGRGYEPAYAESLTRTQIAEAVAAG